LASEPFGSVTTYCAETDGATPGHGSVFVPSDGLSLGKGHASSSIKV